MLASCQWQPDGAWSTRDIESGKHDAGANSRLEQIASSQQIYMAVYTRGVQVMCRPSAGCSVARKISSSARLLASS